MVLKKLLLLYNLGFIVLKFIRIHKLNQGLIEPHVLCYPEIFIWFSMSQILNRKPVS